MVIPVASNVDLRLLLICLTASFTRSVPATGVIRHSTKTSNVMPFTKDRTWFRCLCRSCSVLFWTWSTSPKCASELLLSCMLTNQPIIDAKTSFSFILLIWIYYKIALSCTEGTKHHYNFLLWRISISQTRTSYKICFNGGLDCSGTLPGVH